MYAVYTSQVFGMGLKFQEKKNKEQKNVFLLIKALKVVQSSSACLDFERRGFIKYSLGTGYKYIKKCLKVEFISHL